MTVEGLEGLLFEPLTNDVIDGPAPALEFD
jgi:hypothetical protein